MSDVQALLAASERILDGAGRDLARGFWQSACVGAQRAGVLATEAWLRQRGQAHISASVYENVCLSPAAGVSVREAARRLDRHRMEEGYPHRSAMPAADPEAEAPDVVAAGRRILAFALADLAKG